MSQTTTEPRALTLSSKFEGVEHTPLTCAELLEGVESYEGDLVRAAVALSEAGGAKRHRVRPIVKAVGDASALEVADQLFAIAFAHCMREGKPGRYCAELTIREGDAVRSSPVRIYFNLSPELPIESDARAASEPSLEYVRGLESLVLTMTDRLSRVSVRLISQEERRHQMAWTSIERMHRSKLAEGEIAIAQVEAEGRNRRRDRMFDGVFALLPKLADKYIGPAKSNGVRSNLRPVERVAELLTAEQLEGFKAAIGDARWSELESAADIPAARDVLAALDVETQGAILEAVGRDNVLTIATWE